MRAFIIILMVVVMAGCAGLGQTVSTMTMPNGDIYTVASKSDALVEFSQGDVKMTVDNRGRPSMLEKVISLLFLTLPDVEVTR